jgi:hypothetical protein
VAWTSPKTYAANDILTAADLNTYQRDNLLALAPDGATSASWTPVISGTVGGSTDPANIGVEYRIGPLQFAYAHWVTPAFTASPAIGANGTLELVIPANAAGVETGNINGGQSVGVWRLFDTSAPGSSVSGVCYLRSVSRVRFALSDGSNLLDSTITIGADDTFTVSLWYPVA